MSFTYGCFAPILVDIGMVVHEKKIFKFCQCSSSILLLSPFGKEQGPLFEKEMNSLHPRMLCVGFGWNWPSGSGERFLDFFNVLLLFHYYLPLQEGMVLHLNKLESNSPKDAICKVWLKLAQWFWRRISYFSSMHTDSGQKVIRKAHLSFQFRWAKKCVMRKVASKIHT